MSKDPRGRKKLPESEKKKSFKHNMPVPDYLLAEHGKLFEKITNITDLNYSREVLNVLGEWDKSLVGIKSKPAKGYFYQYLYIPEEKVKMFLNVLDFIAELPRGERNTKVKLADVVIHLLSKKYGE